MSRRRQFNTLLLATVLLLMGSLSVSASATSEQAEGALEPVEVSWIFSENPEDMNLEALIETFEAANPTLTIETLWTPSRYTEKVQTLIASGDPPDLMRLNDDYVRDYAVRGLLQPLDEYIEAANIDTEGFIPAFWSWPKVNGKHMAWIKGVTAQVIWVNFDAFEESGVALPPKDSWEWEDLLASARKMTQREGSETSMWGISVSHKLPSAEVTWAVNNGGNVFSEDGRRFVLGEPAGAEAIQWTADLTLEQNVQPPYSTWGQFDETDLFASGNLAMFDGSSREIPSLTRKVGGQFEWGARPFPGRVNHKSGGALDSHVIPVEARNPAEAFQWLLFLTSEEAYRIMGELGFWLPVQPAWANDNWLPGTEIPVDKNIAVRSLDSYLPVPQSNNTQRARQVYWPQIRLVMNGDATAEEALQVVTEEINELLAEF